MGRLFWKFFFFFWLAQVLTSAGVGVAVWMDRAERNAEAGMTRQGPPLPGHPAPGHPRPPLPAPMPLLPILAGSVVSVLFAALLAWYFARPIRSLRTAFESVAGGRLQTRIGASMGNRNDELADLGSDFDHMADRLEQLLEAQRRLLHDVSHELRSPLARLQAAADLVRQQPERAAEFVERIERDTGRMDTLVGELLTLARLDSGMPGHAEEALDLSDMLAEIADDSRIEAEHKHCSIDLEVDGLLVVRGSHELLYRAIENVVRNAVLHSPEGGRVSISAQPKDGRLHIAIADKGAGVPEGDLATIFDPFVRSGSGQSIAGYGLGLAITRRVIEAHGGAVSAANRAEGGLVVVLELPQERPT